MTPTNIVNVILNAHIIPDFNIFDNLSICILSVNFDNIIKLANIKTSGIIIVCIKFPIKFIINKIIGSIMPLVVMLPV